MATTDTTISIPVTSAWHFGVGAALVVAAITGFLVHLELPADHQIRGTALGVGVISGSGAMIYWLWCAVQSSRAETAEQREATEELREDIADLKTCTKELTGAVNALQDTYLQEGPPDGG